MALAALGNDGMAANGPALAWNKLRLDWSDCG